MQNLQVGWEWCRVYGGVGVGAGFRGNRGGGGAVFTECGLCSPGFYIWC